MELNIKQADNGYVLSYYDGEIKETRYIAVEDLDNGVSCISGARLTQKLLFEICEHFGCFTAKHSEEQLQIMVVDKNGKEIDG